MTAPTESGAGVAASGQGILDSWSPSYLGVQHYPARQRYSTTNFRATVVDSESFATCQIWTPGCGLSPIETDHDSAADARTHAEQQLHMMTRGATGAHP